MVSKHSQTAADWRGCILLAGLAALTLVACKPRQQQKGQMAPPVPSATAQQPIVRDVIDWDTYPGRLAAVDMVEVRARVSGYLQSINFKDGAEVAKGDLLFVIDPRPYEAEKAQAEANLNQALTRLELAKNDLGRAERLLKVKAISEEEADSRNKATREADSAVAAARAMVQAATLNVDYTRITAPISGRIGRKMMTEGNLVNAGQGQSSMLTTIVSVDPVYCYFDADEKAVLRYQQLARAGKVADMRAGTVPCEIHLANETNFVHKGVLDFVDNQVDPRTGTLRVRGVFPNPGPARVLEPGFFCRVRVPGSSKYSAMLIPDEAVGTDQSQKYVLVVNDQDTAEYRTVKLGPLVDGLRVVRDGLRSNDWVLVTGLMSVRPGSKVAAKRGPAGAGIAQSAGAVH